MAKSLVENIAMESPLNLPDWDRKLYQPGGGDAFLFYVVFGSFQQPMTISGSRYQTAGLPEEVSLGLYERESERETLESFVQGFLARRFANDEPEVYEKVITAPQCLVVSGTVKDPDNLNYLRDTLGVVSAILDNGGIAIYDPQKFHWWSPDQWREAVLKPRQPLFNQHVSILISPEDEKQGKDGPLWLHTRGMRKFGRPDLSLRNLPPEKIEAGVDLCNYLIEDQILGLNLQEGQTLDAPGLPFGITCHHRGDLEDPDFNNVHLEIRLPQV